MVKVTHVAAGRWRRLVAVAYFAILALAPAVRAPLAAAQVPSPTVEGRVSGNNGTPFIAATTFDLAPPTPPVPPFVAITVGSSANAGHNVLDALDQRTRHPAIVIERSLCTFRCESPV